MNYFNDIEIKGYYKEITYYGFEKMIPFYDQRQNKHSGNQCLIKIDNMFVWVNIPINQIVI